MFKESNINPNELIPTKKWHIKDSNEDISELYVKNVLNYDKVYSKNLMDYRINDLKNIERLKQSNLTQSYQNEIQFYNDDLISLHYDNTEPRLRFIFEKQDDLNPFDAKLEMLKSLMDYADKRDYFNSYSAINICMKVTNGLSGNLRLSGDEFYKIHPLKEIFFNNFSNLNVTWVEND